MLRRWSVILVVVFGLLAGVAAPALSCAAAAKGDCCPQGSTSPCDEEKRQHDSGSVEACCVNVAAEPSAVGAEPSRNMPDRQHDSGSPDPIVTFAWFATLSSHLRPPQLLAPAILLPRTDAALTYLHTGRLRL